MGSELSFAFYSEQTGGGGVVEEEGEETKVLEEALQYHSSNGSFASYLEFPHNLLNEGRLGLASAARACRGGQQGALVVPKALTWSSTLR